MTSHSVNVRLSLASENSAAHRIAVASRLGAALLGGYLIANTFAILLARILVLMTITRADGVLIAVIISFLIYAGAVLWAFAAHSATRAWVGLLSMSGMFGVAAWWLGNGAAA